MTWHDGDDDDDDDDDDGGDGYDDDYKEHKGIGRIFDRLKNLDRTPNSYGTVVGTELVNQTEFNFFFDHTDQKFDLAFGVQIFERLVV